MGEITGKLASLGYSPNDSRMVADLYQKLIHHIMQEHPYTFKDFYEEISKAFLFLLQAPASRRVSA